jgi:putative transcription factor
MICELCGKNVTFCKKVTVEGVQLQVCSECAKFGIEAKNAQPREEAPKPIITQRLEIRERRGRPRDVLAGVEKEELVEDFAARIRNARSKKGMTQKDLAMKINERVTVLSKVEIGQMRPDDKMVAKLEKELGIKLKEKVVETQVAKGTSTSALTLADLIKMQKD